MDRIGEPQPGNLQMSFRTRKVADSVVSSLNHHTFPLKVVAQDSVHCLIVSDYQTKNKPVDANPSLFDRIISKAEDFASPCVPYVWIYTDDDDREFLSIPVQQRLWGKSRIDFPMHPRHYGEMGKLMNDLGFIHTKFCFRSVLYARDYLIRLIANHHSDPVLIEQCQQLIDDFNREVAMPVLDVQRFSKCLENMISIVMHDLFRLDQGESPMNLHQVWLGNEPPLTGRNVMANMSTSHKYQNIKIHFWGEKRYCSFLNEPAVKPGFDLKKSDITVLSKNKPLSFHQGIESTPPNQRKTESSLHDINRVREYSDARKHRFKYRNIEFHDIASEFSPEHFTGREEKWLAYIVKAIIELQDPKCYSSAADIMRTMIIQPPCSAPVAADIAENSRSGVRTGSDNDSASVEQPSFYLDFGKVPLTRIENMRKRIPAGETGFIHTINQAGLKTCLAMGAYPGTFDKETYQLTLYLHTIACHDQDHIIKGVLFLRTYDDELRNQLEVLSVFSILLGASITEVEDALNEDQDHDALLMLMYRKYQEVTTAIKNKNSLFNRLSDTEIKERIDQFLHFKSTLLNLSEHNYKQLGNRDLTRYIDKKYGHCHKGKSLELSMLSNRAATLLVDQFCTLQQTTSRSLNVVSQFKYNRDESRFRSYYPDGPTRLIEQCRKYVGEDILWRLPIGFKNRQTAYLQLVRSLPDLVLPYIQKKRAVKDRNAITSAVSKNKLISRRITKKYRTSIPFSGRYTEFYRKGQSGGFEMIPSKQVANMSPEELVGFQKQLCFSSEQIRDIIKDDNRTD